MPRQSDWSRTDDVPKHLVRLITLPGPLIGVLDGKLPSFENGMLVCVQLGVVAPTFLQAPKGAINCCIVF